MGKKYSAIIYNQAKLLYVNEDKSPKEIAKEFDDKPSWKTIQRWACIKDKDGKTWNDLRQEKRDLVYDVMSPEALADIIFKDLYKLMNSEQDPVRKGDALAKYQRFIDRILDPKYQINMTFYVLKDLISFIQKQYPELITDKLMEATKHYKDHRLKKLAGSYES